MRLGLMAFLMAAACASGTTEEPRIDSGGPGPGEPDAADVGPPMCATECTGGDECCNVQGAWFCLSTSSDVNNCGSCGNQCDVRPNLGNATACMGSQCVCGFAPACGAGFTCCTVGATSTCENLMTDNMNCGSCGNACGAGSTCTGGQCLCNGEVCGAGESCCPGVGCVNTATDPNHCGNCTTVCTGATPSCNAGLCGCPGGTGACTTGSCCGSTCADICNDSMNCGMCGYSCSGGIAPCFFGVCFGEEGSPPPECLM